MEITNNLDLLSVGIVVASTAILGFTVYYSNRHSITNKTFLLFSLVTAIWGFLNYYAYHGIDQTQVLWFFRFQMFFAVWQAFLLFQFLFVFPKENYIFPGWYKKFITPLVFLTSILTLSPFVFSGVETMTTGDIPKTIVEKGIILFGIVAVGLVLSSIILLVKKINASSEEEKHSLNLILIGIILMFSLIIVFNLILAGIYLIVKYIPFSALFVFPFILFTSYSILKHKLFNIKVVSTAILVFLLTIVLFLEIIFANSFALIVFRSSIFLLVLIFGINLIRSVVKEVEQREELAKLNINLEDLLKQRESLVHLVTHKVKGSFTRTKILFASILDGTFGDISPEIRKRAEQGLEFDNAGIETVDLVLNVANMQKGLVKYEMKKIDFKELVLKTIADEKNPIDAKGLKLETEIPDGVYNVLGDTFWLKEVVHNLIDNATRYSKEGKIIVGLKKSDILAKDGTNKILFSVKDNGVGIIEEDRKNLFTEGGRGKDSVKINVNSTGYGLYTIKLVIEAHKGRVWVESEGADKGSTFYVELDAQ